MARAEGEVEHAEDAVHGRADLVAHVGQELALGPVGGLGGLLGPLQLFVRMLAVGDVADDALNHRAFRCFELTEANLDGKLAAVCATPVQF